MASEAQIQLPGEIQVTPKQPDDDPRIFRASEMGKPALVTAYRYFVDDPPKLDERSQLIFWMGHAFEAWLKDYLERSDWEIIEEQPYCELEGISGHADFLVRDAQGSEFIIDAKAVNKRCFNSYIRYGLFDDRGYETQLAVYSTARLVPACLVMLNKETHEVNFAFLDQERVPHRIKRALSIKDVIESSTCFADCFKYFQPPIPKAETHKKEHTGRLLPPNNMLHSPLLNELYETYEDTNPRKEVKTYVLDYKYPSGMEQYKPDIEEQVFGS